MNDHPTRRNDLMLNADQPPTSRGTQNAQYSTSVIIILIKAPQEYA